MSQIRVAKVSTYPCNQTITSIVDSHVEFSYLWASMKYELHVQGLTLHRYFPCFENFLLLSRNSGLIENKCYTQQIYTYLALKVYVFGK